MMWAQVPSSDIRVNFDRVRNVEIAPDGADWQIRADGLVVYTDTTKAACETQLESWGAIPEPTQLAIKRGVTDYETRLDYGARVDGQPVYLGRNTNAAATSAATWTIEKVTYDGLNNPTRKQVLTGAWDSRASLPW